MTPELSARVAALEANLSQVRSDVSALSKQTENLDTLVRALTPLNEKTATLVEQAKALQNGIDDIEGDVDRVEKKFDKRWDKLEDAQESNRKDSRSLRNILIGVGCAAVLSPIGGIVVALIVAKP